MKKLYLNTGGLETIFENLQDSLQGTLTSENNQYNLVIKSKKSKGTISGISFTKQLAYIDFDMEFNDDVILSMESSVNSPVVFAYCTDGTLEHSFGINGEKKNLKENQAGILRNTSGINSVLFFKAFQRVKFSIISSNVSNLENVENSDLFAGLNTIFTNPSGNYRYVGQLNLKIAEKLLELKNVPQKGIVGNLVKKRILESILGTEMALHSYGYMKAIQPILTLANKQIDDLKRISNLNIAEVIYGVGQARRHYLPRLLKGKHHLAFSFHHSKTS
ncbi:hypothetical protein [Flavobacterium piscis]|uniref:Uncharacterized protein n=1 Tax=Flavobacterium piscis TaxID=1114874 RepID=A0ABU1Y9A9_9FLAO|nr:hypothetical protein [Flavobacterium piscis]MDR7210829.1 hypothetical protein [Flavobacterium piscis]